MSSETEKFTRLGNKAENVAAHEKRRISDPKPHLDLQHSLLLMRSSPDSEQASVRSPAHSSSSGSSAPPESAMSWSCVSLFYVNDISSRRRTRGECLCIPFALTLTLAMPFYS